MTRPARRRRAPPSDPRQQAEAQGYDMGSPGIAVVVEHVAVGTRSTHPRARRADPLVWMPACTAEMRVAAELYRRAWQHCEAGLGMGPLDPEVERARAGYSGLAAAVPLLPQERAISASAWHRRGEQAMGLAASQGVVNWVVIRGGGAAAYDAVRRWRKGTASAQLLAALGRLAVEYGLAEAAKPFDAGVDLCHP